MTTIKPRQLNGQFAQILANAPGFIGMASDLVTYEERLANIFQNILGVTAIFNTIDNANKAARAVRFQVRMVTLDGSEIRLVEPLPVVPISKIIVSLLSPN